MKHEWRKHEKHFYLPKAVPEIIEVPSFSFFTIEGEGNPNDDHFPDYIQALYSVSYAIKMSPKKNMAPDNYSEYTVYPLEGVWDIKDEAKKNYSGTLDKNDLKFKLMIRQPNFVTTDFAMQMLAYTKEKKKTALLDKVCFESIQEGLCIQMLHKGPYDDEPASFLLMEQFAQDNNLKRISRRHREIYLNDARKTQADKLKTVLRFQVQKN
jgi:hypothetical protein